MLDIKGAVAVITGGGGGIGESIAKYWVTNGGKVVLHDVVPDGLARVEKDIRQMNGEVATLVGNVTKEADNTALAKMAEGVNGQGTARIGISQKLILMNSQKSSLPRRRESAMPLYAYEHWIPVFTRMTDKNEN